jgi:hypothetical protein
MTSFSIIGFHIFGKFFTNKRKADPHHGLCGLSLNGICQTNFGNTSPCSPHVLSVAEMFRHLLEIEKKNAVTILPGSSGQPKILLMGLTSQLRH